MATTILTQDRLKELLDYNPETGVFTWKRIPGKQNSYAGKQAGCIRRDGYRVLRIDGSLQLEHRLAWLYVFGNIPEIIDHLNGDRTNNRPENLRDSDFTTNNQNWKSAQGNSKIGILGVWRRTHATHPDTFAARIGVNGKTVHLGEYSTPEEAHSAYLVAKRRLHPGNML